MHFLLLEDDPILGELLYEHLSLKFKVTHAQDGLEAYENIIHNHFDMLILDVSVPFLDGFELLKLLREEKISTPTLFITSLNASMDVKKGFDVGGNDYLKKPFEFIELDARIHNLIKQHKLEQKTYHYKDFKIDTQKQLIFHGDLIYRLSHKESKMIEYLLKNRSIVVPTEEIIANVWHYEETPNGSTIRTYIKNLRAILGKESIESIKGVGYVLL